MEVNKLNELYLKVSQKYSFDIIDNDKNGKIDQDEILTIVYKDEELKAELDISDMELIEDSCMINEESDNKENSSSVDNETNVNNSNSLYNQQLLVFLAVLSKLIGTDSTELFMKLQNILASDGISDTNINSGLNNTNNNNNNNNINYDNLKSVYETYLENTETIKLNQSSGKYSAETSSQLDIDGKSIEVPLSDYYWSGIKEDDKWKNIKINEIVDINNDGEVTFEDLKLIPEDVDLDGDGEISNQEKKFLKTLKVRLYANLKLKTVRNIKTSKIDDIISYLEFNETDETISNSINSAYSWLKKQGALDSGKQFVNENSSVWASYGVSAQSIGQPNNMVSAYLSMISKSNLTKDELNDILNKINSSSETVQNQLSEVKQAVNEKLNLI